MSKRCYLTGVGAQTGHKVSHSNRKAKRRFVPNLQNVSFFSRILNSKISLRVTPATLRTVDHNGGIDSYLLETSNLKLTDLAQKIKRKLKKLLHLKKDETSEIIAKPQKKISNKPPKFKRPIKKVGTKKVNLKKLAKQNKKSASTAS